MQKRTTTLAVAGALAAVYAGGQYGRRNRLRRLKCKIPPGQTIVVVGAGFAGTCAGRCLGRLLPPELYIRITLIDHRNCLLFTPMLSEVAGGELDPVHIVGRCTRFRPESTSFRRWWRKSTSSRNR